MSYTEADRQRYVQEEPKSHMRGDFERDRARILHSAGLRRLGAKTQVLGPYSDDFIRTRLTHSLEVAQVGRALAHELGADPDVVDTACLAHDLGHPPFGHNGERALAEVAKDIGSFEGNAQTLRLVTRLEPKVVDAEGRPAGLNLTRASLDAIAKYPWLRGQGPDARKSQQKFCVYEDDAPVFEWLREGVPAGKRCLEAQIMDLSDDIAYSVHDVEDGIRLGAIDPTVLDDQAMQEVFETTRKWYGDAASNDDLGNAWDRLRSYRWWIGSYSGSYADQAALKDLTSQLIGRFISAAYNATRQRYGNGPLSRYEAGLVMPKTALWEILVLKGLAVHYLMAPRENQPTYLQQRTLLFDLCDALMERGESALEEPMRTAWREAEDDDDRLRAVIDQVASLTDISAHQWHGRLCGMFSR